MLKFIVSFLFSLSSGEKIQTETSSTTSSQKMSEENSPKRARLEEQETSLDQLKLYSVVVADTGEVDAIKK